MAFPIVETTATTNGSAATASAVVTMPAGIVAGDLLLVLHRSAIGTDAHTASGWTNLFNDNSDASDDRISLWYKVAAGGDTCTIGQTSSKFASLAWRISGAENPATQAPQFATLVTGTSATPDPGSLTPTGGAKDYLWLWMGGWEGEQTSPPAGNPTNYASNVISANSGTGGVVATNVRCASASRNLNAASEDPGSWTISVSDDWTATVVAIHPSSGVVQQGTATLTASSVVSVVGALILGAVAAISGSGSVAVAGVLTHGAAVAVSGAATVAAAGTVAGTQLGVAALTASATTTAVGSVATTHLANAALSATASVAAVGSFQVVDVLGAAALQCATTVTPAASVSPDIIRYYGKIFTVATLPPATDSKAGSIVYVSDAASGQRFKGNYGSTWENLG